MIDEKTIHAMGHDGYDSYRLRRWVDQLLAERELLVAEHNELSAAKELYGEEDIWMVRQQWQAVEDFDPASVPKRSNAVVVTSGHSS